MPHLTPDLTPAERRVLMLMLGGRNTAAIARELCIERSTVKRHRQNLYYKSDTHDVAALVHWGRGWLQTEQQEIERALNVTATRPV
ncbi:MAG: LuxR C-terminal-related transcriptional regulator [Dehalococcoidia bacterium]